MAIFDISIGIDESLPLWPGDPELRLHWAANIEQGDSVNLTELSMGIHTGTHIDAPLHFLPEGKPIDSLSLNVLVGEAQVVAIPPDVNLITVDFCKMCAKLMQPGSFLRLKIRSFGRLLNFSRITSP